MESNSGAYVVAIRFSKVGKLYHFDATHVEDLQVGDWVVVETARGWQLGEVAQLIGSVSQSDNGGWKAVDRKATPADLLKRKSLELREEEALILARKVSFQNNFEGLKIVSVELSLDATRVSILYSIEGDAKYDLRAIKQEVGRLLHPAQVELRQIGPRDVAKIFGGMGACGLPKRCCSQFLTDFSSISIRMAKEQGISLTPTEITGMCGRLRCCLIYEYEHYVENRKKLPKRNKRVMTPVGEGKVVELLPLKMAAVVDIPEVGRKEFFHSDIENLDEYLAKKREHPQELQDQKNEEQQNDASSENSKSEMSGGQTSSSDVSNNKSQNRKQRSSRGKQSRSHHDHRSKRRRKRPDKDNEN